MTSNGARRYPGIEVLGVRFDLVGFHQAIGIVIDWATQNQAKRMVVTPGPEFVLAAGRDRAFYEILKKADLSITDGRGIQFAARFLGLPVPERIPGTDFMIALCKACADHQISVFFLGGQEGIAEKCASGLRVKFPELRIAGCLSGSPMERGDSEAIKAINATDAQMIFVAYGAPKQEQWIARNLDRLQHIRVAMGVGGAFDYISRHISRAPYVFRQTGLEWLWRLMVQPQRILRMIRAVIVFPSRVFLSRWKKT